MTKANETTRTAGAAAAHDKRMRDLIEAAWSHAWQAESASADEGEAAVAVMARANARLFRVLRATLPCDAAGVPADPPRASARR